MRTSLLPGLLSDVARARRHQGGAVTLFELARTYHPRPGEPLPDERWVLAIALAGPRTDHVGPSGDYDFYDGKGAFASILEAALGAPLDATSDDALSDEAPYLHPRRRARLSVDGTPCGHLGEVHPDLGDELDLDVRVVYGEIALDALSAIAAARGVPQSAPLPRFPSVTRDVALVVDEAVEVARVVETLRGAGVALLEHVELFDVYRGEGIGEGLKSLAFRVVYRDPDATLTDKKVEKAHSNVVRAAQEALGATARG